MATSFGFRQFARRMRVISDKVEKNSARAVVRAALAADQVAVNATPVDTGRARGNWRASVGNPDFGFDPEAKDRSGGPTIARNQAIITTWEVGRGPIFISNSVPYIVPLDQGSSAQAPGGMSQLAVQAARAQLDKAGLLDGV